MAWLDNRAWCHPKIVNLTDKAHRVWINSLCYSAGFVTNGRLTKEQQALVGSSVKVRRELENAGLWLDDGPDILIHDWDEHNGERDRSAERRKRLDRERKARARSAPRPADSPADSRQEIRSLKGEGVKGEETTTREADLIDLRKAMNSIGRAI